MPGSGEALHPHRLAARHVHGIRIPGPLLPPGKPLAPRSDGAIRDLAAQWMQKLSLSSGIVSIDELWGIGEISRAAAGSKRRLVRALGGWGDCPGRSGVVGDQEDEWEVCWPEGEGAALSVRNKKIAEVKQKLSNGGGKKQHHERRQRTEQPSNGLRQDAMISG